MRSIFVVCGVMAFPNKRPRLSSAIVLNAANHYEDVPDLSKMSRIRANTLPAHNFETNDVGSARSTVAEQIGQQHYNVSHMDVYPEGHTVNPLSEQRAPPQMQETRFGTEVTRVEPTRDETIPARRGVPDIPETPDPPARRGVPELPPTPEPLARRGIPELPPAPEAPPRRSIPEIPEPPTLPPPRVSSPPPPRMESSEEDIPQAPSPPTQHVAAEPPPMTVETAAPHIAAPTAEDEGTGIPAGGDTAVGSADAEEAIGGEEESGGESGGHPGGMQMPINEDLQGVTKTGQTDEEINTAVGGAAAAAADAVVPGSGMLVQAISGGINDLIGAAHQYSAPPSPQGAGPASVATTNTSVFGNSISNSIEGE